MAQSAEEDVQALAPDVVQELERLIGRLHSDDGQVTLEAIFQEGRYVRGFLKLGPIGRDELRELAREATT